MPDPMLRRSYHTHTHRCKHASGDCLDYALAARERGMEVLGFSDHTPLPDGRWPEVRMDLEELDAYDDAVRTAQVEVPELLVLMGMECEYTPDYAGFYRDELLGARSYDYLIGAAHYVFHDSEWSSTYRAATAPTGLRAYVDQVEATIASGLFVCIAHPDLFGACNPTWTDDCAAAARDICQAAAGADVLLELNAYGLRKPRIDTPQGERAMYPWLPFWEIAGDCGVKVSCNADAHRPEDVAHGGTELGLLRDRCGLQEVDLLMHLETRAP